MPSTMKTKIMRLLNRIEVLERRNRTLRSEVETLSIGKQPGWTPFAEASVGIFGDGRIVNHGGGQYRVLLNSRYQVAVFEVSDSPLDCRCVHLSIKRVDGAAVHDWRDFQRIKNEVIGPEAEGVELYPAESRLVDGANQYHLYVIIGQRWPLGFTSRLVSEDESCGVQQRPWTSGEAPEDITVTSPEELARFAGLEQ